MEERKSNGEIPLVVIAGPTATGKTDLSILLAERIGRDIVSADSVRLPLSGYRKRNQQLRGGIFPLYDRCCYSDAIYRFRLSNYARKHILISILEINFLFSLEGPA